jgi:uncharacterized membrane protein (DUF4010 family)
MINAELLQPFAVSLLLGALLGFERAFTSKMHVDADDVLGGIRTFSLVALFGCVSAYLGSRFGHGFLLASFAGIILLVSLSYAISFYKHNEPGITTEISILLTFSIGVLAHLGQFTLAAAIAIVTSIVLYLKGASRDLTRKIESDDIRAVLKFAIITFVVLPLFDPAFSLTLGDVTPLRQFLEGSRPAFLGIELINPHTVWLMVVLISGIGFTGYLSTKLLGSRKGIGLTGLLGGLVSSTATTLEFSKRSREAESHSLPFALAILLACTTMFPRILVEVLIINPALLGALSVTMGFMALGGFAMSFFVWKKSGTEKTGEVPLKNPFSIMPAVKFGLLYAVIVLLARVMESVAGQGGLYIVSALSGLTDVDAITLTMSQISRQDPSKNGQAAVAITLAAFANTLMKGFLAATIGSKRMRKIVLAGFGLIIIMGLLGLLVLRMM